MSRWLLSEAAAQDLDELCTFLRDRCPDCAVEAIDVVTHALEVRVAHPLMGRPLGQGLRELFISRGRPGYLAVYGFDSITNIASVLAIRHQQESGYH